MKFFPLVVLTCVGLGVAACGQKGSLRLPDTPKHPHAVPQPPDTPAPEKRAKGAVPVDAAPGTEPTATPP